MDAKNINYEDEIKQIYDTTDLGEENKANALKVLKKIENIDFKEMTEDNNRLQEFITELSVEQGMSFEDLKDMYERAVDMYNQYHFKEAEALFSAYSMLSPYDHRGPGGLAAIYLETKEYTKALELLEAMQSYPTSDLNEVFLNLSLCQYKLNHNLKAAGSLLLVKLEELSEFYKKRHEFLTQQLHPYLA